MDRVKLGQEERNAGQEEQLDRLRAVQGHAIEEADEIRGAEGSREGASNGEGMSGCV